MMRSYFCLFELVLLTALLMTPPSAAVFPRFFPNISSALPPSSHIPNLTAVGGPWKVFQNLTGCHRGDNLAGLSGLKKYFREFGYILDPNNHNFTDDFDDKLENALRTYQRNFNLNQTGELDDQTLRRIVQPRCGVADIINGTSSMNSGKSSSPPPWSTQLHAVQHYTFFPGQPSWTKQTLTYAFLSDNQLPDDVKDVFARAFDRWATVTPLTFTEATSYSSADIRIGFYSGDHGDGEPFDGVLGTLAHAFSPPSGRFHLDKDENWMVNGVTSSGTYAAVDLESVAVHEIGHVLGLGHSSVEESIMYPTLATGSTRLDLATDDVQGIQKLYGSNPNNNVTATAPTVSSQERESSDGGVRGAASSGLAGAMAVGLLSFLL